MCYIDEAFRGIDRVYWEALTPEEQKEYCDDWAAWDKIVDDMYKQYEGING